MAPNTLGPDAPLAPNRASHPDLSPNATAAAASDTGSTGPQRNVSRSQRPRQSSQSRSADTSSDATVYGALDLGTNNCRLLLARPTRRSFRVIDAFSRIIRLGEGVGQSGRLSDPAMSRTMDALKVCAGKLNRHGVTRTRMVATQACRIASNGASFIDAVERQFGLAIEVLTPEMEARLAVAGCVSLIDPSSDYALVFDIGGGSSEIIWLDLALARGAQARHGGRLNANDAIIAWTSLPVGVVTLAERFDGRTVTPKSFASMSDEVMGLLEPFEREAQMRERLKGRSMHMLGTSGTVTTIAGIQLNLPRYDRSRVDGLWLRCDEINATTRGLLEKSYEQRIAEPCIGRERADLVLAGCAILDAVLRMWPAERLRVADRGLREGILTTLMMEDGVWRAGRRRRTPRPETDQGGASI